MKWEMVKLRDVASLIGGYAFKSSNMKDECLPDYHPVIKIRNVSTSGKLDLSSVQYHEYSKELELYSIHKGDVLIAMTGATVGKVSVSTYDNLLLNQRVGLIRPKEGLFHHKFLYHSLCNTLFYDYCQFTAGGGAQGNISPSQILEYKVPLPPLHIQEQIADTVDKADALRRKDQELLQKYDELAEAIFYDMSDQSTGTTVSLLDVCHISSKLVDPKDPSYKYLLHVGGDNIESNTGKLFGCKKAHELGLTSGKFLFDNTMILYNKIRPYLNKVAMPNFSGLCSADMYPISPSYKITKEYLYAVLSSKDFLSYASNRSRRANIPKINREEMFQYEFKLPDLNIQKKYTEKIIGINKLKNNLDQSIKQSDLLFGSIQKSLMNV